MNTPLLTIGIATLNRPQYLSEAINSICTAAAASTKYKIELIISDMGSNPKTSQVAKEFQSVQPKNLSIIYIHDDSIRSGIENWKRCLVNATGLFYMMIGDDDRVHPNDFSEFLKTLLNLDAAISVVLGSPTDIDSLGNITYKRELNRKRYNPNKFLQKVATRTLPIRWCCFTFRTEQLRACQPFDLPFPGGGGSADGAAILAGLDMGDALVLDLHPSEFRRHESNDSQAINLEYQISQREIFHSFISSRIKSPQLIRLAELWNANGIYFQILRWASNGKLDKISKLQLSALAKKMENKIKWKELPLHLRLFNIFIRNLSHAIAWLFIKENPDPK